MTAPPSPSRASRACLYQLMWMRVLVMSHHPLGMRPPHLDLTWARAVRQALDTWKVSQLRAMLVMSWPWR